MHDLEKFCCIWSIKSFTMIYNRPSRDPLLVLVCYMFCVNTISGVLMSCCCGYNIATEWMLTTWPVIDHGDLIATDKYFLPQAIIVYMSLQ